MTLTFGPIPRTSLDADEGLVTSFSDEIFRKDSFSSVVTEHAIII